MDKNEDRELGKFMGVAVRLEGGKVVERMPDGHEMSDEPMSWNYNGHFQNWLRRRGVVFLDEANG